MTDTATAVVHPIKAHLDADQRRLANLVNVAIAACQEVAAEYNRGAAKWHDIAIELRDGHYEQRKS